MIAGARKHIFRLLSSNGDGTGISDAIGDYSVTPLSLKLIPTDTTYPIELWRMIVMIQDSGTFDASKYGNGIILTNGIRIYVRDKDDNILEELTMFPIISSGDWAGHCHDLKHHKFGVGDEIISIRWTFSKSGAPITLDFSKGTYLEVYLNDDFTGLNKHLFGVQGYFPYGFYY